MLSRTAGSLYWIGRYVERAEFTARLIEATIRLDALSPRPAGQGAWDSALLVAAADYDFGLTNETRSPLNISRYLTLSASNPSSIRSCLDAARSNAKSVRTALSRDAWEAINRAWLNLRGRATTGGNQSTLSIVEAIRAETRGFEGALHRMLRNEAYAFIGLGAAIERADNTARLIDVKYHLLLPDGERVGGPIDRDQWTTILHAVSANTAYRWLYSEGLKPWLVAELLCLRKEMPRSLAASAEEVVMHLNAIGKRTGLQSEADRIARMRQSTIERTSIDTIFSQGLHEWLSATIADNGRIHQAIGAQFRFG
ncbi:alpha-E domain-containing protein [Sphingomonas montanisoli]|uniref:Alpha-E domain-containing protein n=1 Tax=Sphingomonas montanisoli TaxID=2606412 RepID=A0A5D9C1B6_9SPHN|nr:alpha-E domain-containing protein [Sphingomonas montanisoli]TZG25203.1 alpha-E domain-containing protein [Sphingomonas montanisoli]